MHSCWLTSPGSATLVPHPSSLVPRPPRERAVEKQVGVGVGDLVRGMVSPQLIIVPRDEGRLDRRGGDQRVQLGAEDAGVDAVLNDRAHLAKVVELLELGLA